MVLHLLINECEECGDVGAFRLYDFDGDKVCGDCYDKLDNRYREREQEHYEQMMRGDY